MGIRRIPANALCRKHCWQPRTAMQVCLAETGIIRQGKRTRAATDGTAMQSLCPPCSSTRARQRTSSINRNCQVNPKKDAVNPEHKTNLPDRAEYPHPAESVKGITCNCDETCTVRPNRHCKLSGANPTSFSTARATPVTFITGWRSKTWGNPVVRLQARHLPGRCLS